MMQHQGADIYFGDAAHIRSSDVGRSWCKKAAPPSVAATGARHGMSLLSAISARAHMRFSINQQGGAGAVVFIEFPKRLMAGAEREIILLAGRGPALIAKKTRAFGDSLKRKLQLLYLPPCSRTATLHSPLH